MLRVVGSRVHRWYTVVVFVLLASLDNVAIGLVPPLYEGIGQGLGVRPAAVGWATAATYVLSAVAAVGWAYLGDRANRKHLLMAGTLLWAAGAAGTALSGDYVEFLMAQLGAAAGLGAVGSVGFSVVSDLISPARRGLAMSFWGLSQGVGTLAGTLLGGLLGAADWRRPFWAIAGLGLVASAAYLLTVSVRRGQNEPELADLFRSGQEYEHRIDPADLGAILRCGTNRWLIAQGLFAQVTFGSLVWLPQLFRARAQSQGYSLETATVIGSVYATLFQLGGVLSLLGGLIGDRWQRRTPRGRALVAAIGVLGGIPFYLVLFWVPFRFDLPAEIGAEQVGWAVLRSVATDPATAGSFLTALVALGLTSANAPNWFALISDVNPPEHRGTVYSLVNLVNGVGRGAGNGLAGMVFRTLGQGALGSGLPGAGAPGVGTANPGGYALGLAGFQLFFLPTALAFYLASRTAPRDITRVRQVLQLRNSRAVGAGNDQPR